MRKANQGFTLVEMLIVIVAVGIIGSITARLLFQGSDIFVGETNRQGFISEVRSSFWRVFRETHGQNSKEDYIFSSSNNLYIRHTDNIQKQILVDGQSLNLKIGNGAQNNLSNKLSSASLTYYDNNYSLISPPQGGLTENQAKSIHISKIDFTFVNDEDTLKLSSFIYPYNFKYGEKMTYHE
ncbi:MAG: type II secretion system protein [Candidatus Neomarinimicrobiota bacterium]|tara:strand:- start:431 stop:976 length:546 start_codon:yes stop_codon:yes gene_type:complete